MTATTLPIALIIPTYNGTAHLRETVASVQAQTHRAWTLLIVDDGSTDDTLAFAQQLAQMDQRIAVLPIANSGVAAARNAGYRSLDNVSQAVMFLDHDDILFSDTLERLAASLLAHPEASGVAGALAVIDEQGQPLPSTVLGISLIRRQVRGLHMEPVAQDAPTTTDVILASDHIVTPGQVLIRRACVPAEGLFPACYDSYDDWMAWIELTRHGPLVETAQPVLQYRMHPGNQSQRTKQKMDRARRAIWRAVIRGSETPSPVRRRACIAFGRQELLEGAAKVHDAWQHVRTLDFADPRAFMRPLVCYVRVAEAAAWWLRLAVRG